MGVLLSGVGFLGGAWLGACGFSAGINSSSGSLGGRAFLGVGSSRGFYDLKIAQGFATL